MDDIMQNEEWRTVISMALDRTDFDHLTVETADAACAQWLDHHYVWRDTAEKFAKETGLDPDQNSALLDAVEYGRGKIVDAMREEMEFRDRS